MQTAEQSAEQLIHDRGQRVTPVRTAVLGVLLQASGALAHTDVLERLQAVGEFDRVTVYRVLDWLVAQGLVHKVLGAGRASRFQATDAETAHQHGHFQCRACGKVYCLSAVKLPLPLALPANFKAEAVELNIKGVCADCAELRVA
ncbi:MAG: transcriptional repressor [Sulfuriferula sp.]|nr:transcriptional repressor [Sulfuriferula sp.]